MSSARALFTSITLATLVASTALAQTPPVERPGGNPFGHRPGSNHGGPFTPGTDGNPAGPYTPGTTPGNGGTGPFTPGADGNPAGPYTPGIDGPSSGGPFTREDGNGGGGFWGRVKSFGSSLWGGVKSVGRFIWTLGGLAPWSHAPAVGTLPNNGFGNNSGRFENTNPDPGVFNNEPGTTVGTAPEEPTGTTGNGATSENRRRRPGAIFLTP